MILRIFEKISHQSCALVMSKYEVQRFEAADIWLVGASEVCQGWEGGEAVAVGFLGRRSLPLPVAGHSLHFFHFRDGVATVLLADGRSSDGEAHEGQLRKFRLPGTSEADLGLVHWEADGPPRPVSFQFPAVQGAGHGAGSYEQALRDFRAAHCGCPERHAAGRDRCGTNVARLGDWRGSASEFPMEVVDLGDGSGAAAQLASWRVNGHVNNTVQSLGDTLLLFAGEHAGEDAFYGSMRLLELATGKELQSFPLQGIEHGFIEVEWPRGVLEGGTQTFFTAWASRDYKETSIAFATPS